MGVLGDILFRGASLWDNLAGNITTTRKFLRQTGTGAVSAAPAWDTLVAGDLPNTTVVAGSYTNTNLTVDAQGRLTAAANGGGGGGGTVTNTGTLTAGKTIIGNGGVDVTVSALTAQFVGSSSGTEAAASMTTARLLGRTTAGSGAVEEITVGTGLSLSAGSITATGGSGTVTTTGSPASGNLSKFSGATSITNADLTGDVTTAGTVATTLANTAVTPGSYTSTDLTVDSKGRITAASNGTGGSGIITGYVNLQDQQTQNTQGGTFTQGAWQTRVLNTEQYDAGGLCSLSSNQFTLTAGTYIINAAAPAYLVNARHQARLQNVTDNTTLVIGQSMYSPTIFSNTAVTYSSVYGVFTVAASKALELQHQCQVTETTDGFGVAANFSTEIYTVVQLWKIG